MQSFKGVSRTFLKYFAKFQKTKYDHGRIIGVQSSYFSCTVLLLHFIIAFVE